MIQNVRVTNEKKNEKNLFKINGGMCLRATFEMASRSI